MHQNLRKKIYIKEARPSLNPLGHGGGALPHTAQGSLPPDPSVSPTHPMQKEVSCGRRAIYYIYMPLVGYFCHIFSHCSHPYIFLINTSINMLQISACQNVWYSSFYITLKITKIGSKLSFCFLSPHISVPPIFKHFLIEQEYWNFRCGLGPSFCMKHFQIFGIRSLCFPWGPLKEFCPCPPQKKVKFFIYCEIFMKYEIQQSIIIFICLPIIIEVGIYK